MDREATGSPYPVCAFDVASVNCFSRALTEGVGAHQARNPPSFTASPREHAHRVTTEHMKIFPHHPRRSVQQRIALRFVVDRSVLD
ncbi:hypothetical protein NSPZN2_30694 [Nitrospira defluvii]|uniref:Transposase n=1 Tax=Nitrospira defluvii TaxID=330214 RepID=A0ABM8RN81_9BACT|nr:hypothetical protein NSPZN2_30694 [Nitrospira defluvii]